MVYWYMVGLFRAGLKKTIRIKFRDGKQIYAKTYFWLSMK